MEDLRCTGNKFTWFNKQRANLILKKLDWVLINAKWSEIFADLVATFHFPRILDHLSCTVRILMDSPKRRVPFKIFNFGLSNLQFNGIVAEVWE